MYTIEKNRVTFFYARQVLHQRLQELSAQLSLTLPDPAGGLPATDAYAITADEAGTADLLLSASAATAAQEFEKAGTFEECEDGFYFWAECPAAFVKHAPLADQHLLEWFAGHTLGRWLRLRHQDKAAAEALAQAYEAYRNLHRELFWIR